MTEHAVVIAGGGPTGLMLAGELALAGVDVARVERRASQDLPGARAGGLHSRTIEVLDQRGIADRFLSDTGPYRLVRHPGYTGSLLTWTGFALASRSTLVLALVAALLGGAYHHRITAEEQLLQRDLPGYVAYSQHTKKLIPIVW
jgi:2-polyprenyl-6-methoxyphenol hydroxylase-like FAD-dependent oxidoreductase